MSSRRRSRSRSRERARGSSSNSKLRMDTKPQSTRITDPSLPAGRRREIDNVMKKARASPNSNIYWDKKLLEVEAKDPNRWRHSGYKSMYLDGSSSRSPSPGPHRRSRSRSRSLPPSRRSPRSPPMRGGGRSSRSPRSPPPQLHRDSRRSPLPPQVARGSRTAAGGRPRSPPLPSSSNRSSATIAPQQQSGTRRRRSASVSSLSSCSDDSCSVCSPKAGRHRSRSRSRSPPRPVMPRPKILPPVDRRLAQQSQPSVSNKQLQRVRPPSPQRVASPRQLQRMPRPMTPPTAGGSGTNANQRPLHQRPPATIPPQRRSGSNGPPPTDPRRQPPPARPRNRAGEVIDVSASVKPPQMPQPKIVPQQTQSAPATKQARPAADVGAGSSSNDPQQPVLLSRIKKERTSSKRVSPANNAGDSSGSEDSSDNSTSAIVATTQLTLSERFGKMAQWSVDRERRIKNNIENMRITKTGGDLKVMIEADAYLYGDAPRRYNISPVPAGHYPDDLLAAGPAIRGAAWDDVRVRYQYYKDLGYLRDLTLDDYVKWEEWWYKYQDWLANEREYEHWLTTQDRGGGGGGHGHGRRRRKRIPASQRLN